MEIGSITAITGYCPNCSLKEGCLEWAFAASSKLTENEMTRRGQNSIFQKGLEKKYRMRIDGKSMSKLEMLNSGR